MAKKSSYEMILGMLTYQVTQWKSQLAMMSAQPIRGSELEQAVELATRERLEKRIQMMGNLIEELQVPISHVHTI